MILLLIKQGWEKELITVVRAAPYLLILKIEALTEAFLPYLMLLHWIKLLLLPREYSLLHLPLALLHKFHPLLLAQIKQPEGIRYHILLDIIIKRGVRPEGWRLVDFDEPGSKVLVNHDIEPQNLKAHRIIIIVRLARPVYMCHVRLPNYDGLHYDVFYAFHN